MTSGAPRPPDEVLLVDLIIGDQFVFDGHTYTVSESPQSIWGVVEVWVDEPDWPFQGSEARATRTV